MACGGSGYSRSATTWAEIQECVDAITDDGNAFTITVSPPGQLEVTGRLIVDKYVKIVPDGIVEFYNNRGQPPFSAGGDTDESVLMYESEHGPVEFGTGYAGEANNFFWTLAGANFTWHLSPSGFFKFTQTSGTSIPCIVRGITCQTGGVFAEPHSVIGQLMIAPSRGILTGCNLTARIGDGGNAACVNNNSVLRIRDDDSNWRERPWYGNADVDGDKHFYIEKNTFKRFNEMLDLKESGRVVFRYNYVESSGIIHHGTDTESWGARYGDYYGNVFTYTDDLICDANGYIGESGTPGAITPHNGGGHISIHGGTALIHNNVIDHWTSTSDGAKPAIALLQWQMERNDSADFSCWGSTDVDNINDYAGRPVPGNIGWGWDAILEGDTQCGSISVEGNTGVVPDRFQDLEPVYSFNNTGTATIQNGSYTDMPVAGFGGSDCVPAGPAASNFVVEDREFYNQTDLIAEPGSAFNGTSGTGFGPRANRPSSSTNGVAYWSTDQGGNWQLEDIDGTPTIGGNNGCLDKVISGAWADCWYTPFQYPHYLVTGGAAPEPPEEPSVSTNPPARKTRMNWFKKGRR